ncbi:MAG TPA: copper homeostasis membrane protein CopD [Burkholderiales bacterium]
MQTAMDGLTVALRVAHFAAAVALAGEFAFALCVARPAVRGCGDAAGAWLGVRQRLVRVATWCLGLVLVSGALWLLVQAAAMSGAPFADALDRKMLGAVLAETLFGRVWIARLVLAAALGGALFSLRRASRRSETPILVACATLAGSLLASLAWAGHAAAEQGADRVVHLSADVVHLLAAGAWLGALPALASVLARARHHASEDRIEFAAQAIRRFSTLGIASVGALVLSGPVNAWYTLGSVPAFLGTDYGRLLSVKLTLFTAMLALAAINRLRWTPRVSRTSRESALVALSRLQQNAIAETALGLGALGVVGALGVTIPAPHVQTAWPFPRTLDWAADAGSHGIFIGALIVMWAAAALVALGMRARRQDMTAVGIGAAAGAAVTLIWQLAVPAHPSTYFRSPVRYSVASVARGAPLYAEHCAACHGSFGHGDGPVAASLPVRPPYLAARLARRREGDLLWSLGNGIAGTPMSGIGERVGEEGLWDVLTFLRAQANAEAGRRLNESVEPWRPVTAPDFTFQIGRGTQESLSQQRGRSIVLLVFYSPPQSLARLRALAQLKLRFDRLGVRVIAAPMKEAEAIRRNAPGVDAAMIAEPDASLAAVYGMFTRAITDSDQPASPRHAEFLIDRQGYLRARWMAGKEPGWSVTSELLRQAVVLNFEKKRPPAPERHAH